MNSTDEWYDVERVTRHSYRIVEGPHYGLFLVEGSDRSVVIDAGIGVGDLAGLIDELVDTPVTLILTHWHWDHIGNASQFEDGYIHEVELAPDGTAAIDALSDEFTHRPAQFVREWLDEGNQFPDDFDADTYEIEPAGTVSPILPTDVVDLGERQLEAYHTPGHSPGHLALLDREAKVLYGGDVIHLEAGVYAQFQHSDLTAYLETIDRLVQLREDGAFDTLLTSHNPPFVGEELAILDRLGNGLGRILEGDAEPTVVETAWGKTHRYTVDGSPLYTKPTVP